jgi:hypothetical protein
MKTKQIITEIDNRKNPNVDDSIKPDYKVFYRNKSTLEIGYCTFFTYENGVQIIEAAFKALYPEHSILKISAVAQD